GAQADDVQVVPVNPIAGGLGDAGQGVFHRALVQVGHPAALPANDPVLVSGIVAAGRGGEDVALAAVGQVQAGQDAQPLEQAQGAEYGGPPHAGFPQEGVQVLAGKG